MNVLGDPRNGDVVNGAWDTGHGKGTKNKCINPMSLDFERFWAELGSLRQKIRAGPCIFNAGPCIFNAGLCIFNAGPYVFFRWALYFFRWALLFFAGPYVFFRWALRFFHLALYFFLSLAL